ncbi:MAG: methyl-accepting chemotaxis protein, partial [Treponema sp.]|nr:methyl-accepting chemotaxis protein [Treponema sp.]
MDTEFFSFAGAVFIELAIAATLTCIILKKVFKKTLVGTVLLPYVFTSVGLIMTCIIGGYRRNMLDSLLIAPVISAMVVIFAVSLYKRVVYPLRKTAEVIGALHEGKGDLTVRLTYDQNDEIGAISRHLNGFLSNIAALIVEIREEAQETNRNSDALSGSMDKIAESAAAIAAITNDINSMIQEQLSLVDSTARTVRDMNENTARQNDRIDKQSVSVSASSSAV